MERRALGATSPRGSIWIGSLELPDYRGEFMPTGGRWVRGSPWSQCQWVLVQGTHGVGVGGTEKCASNAHSAIREGGSSASVPRPKEEAERREKRDREKQGGGVEVSPESGGGKKKQNPSEWEVTI